MNTSTSNATGFGITFEAAPQFGVPAAQPHRPNNETARQALWGDYVDHRNSRIVVNPPHQYTPVPRPPIGTRIDNKGGHISQRGEADSTRTHNPGPAGSTPAPATTDFDCCRDQEMHDFFHSDQPQQILRAAVEKHEAMDDWAKYLQSRASMNPPVSGHDLARMQDEFFRRRRAQDEHRYRCSGEGEPE